MAEPLLLDISVEASECVSNNAARELKLQAAGGRLPLDPGDLGTVLLYLSHDADQEISSTAISTIRELSGTRLISVIEDSETNPWLLEILAHIHLENSDICAMIASHPAVSLDTLEFLSIHGIGVATELFAAASSLEQVPVGESSLEEDTVEDEQFKSKYQLAQSMGVADKIKMALTGDKEWRGIFIKDSNKLVSSGVMKNPRITDSEVLAIAKSAVQNDDIIRLICSNKEWLKNYNIRKALVENSKTPLPNALRFIASLSDKDIASLAKSKNVSSVISTQAKRIILSKNKK